MDRQSERAAPFWKPWKDGWFENSIKVGGGIFFFLLLAGLFFDLPPNTPIEYTSPYYWTLSIRRAVSDSR